MRLERVSYKIECSRVQWRTLQTTRRASGGAASSAVPPGYGKRDPEGQMSQRKDPTRGQRSLPVRRRWEERSPRATRTQGAGSMGRTCSVSSQHALDRHPCWLAVPATALVFVDREPASLELRLVLPTEQPRAVRSAKGRGAGEVGAAQTAHWDVLPIDSRGGAVDSSELVTVDWRSALRLDDLLSPVFSGTSFEGCGKCWASGTGVTDLQNVHQAQILQCEDRFVDRSFERHTGDSDVMSRIGTQ